MASWDPVDLIAGGVIGGGLFIGLIACIGGFLQVRRERLLMHAERMKALELGRDMPDDPTTARLKAAHKAEQPEESSSKPDSPSVPRSPAAQCYSTTGYVCGTGFVFAWLTQSNQAVALAIASATGAVGVTGMICGTILASKPTESRETGMMAHAKPIFDPEAI